MQTVVWVMDTKGWYEHWKIMWMISSVQWSKVDLFVDNGLKLTQVALFSRDKWNNIFWNFQKKELPNLVYPIFFSLEILILYYGSTGIFRIFILVVSTMAVFLGNCPMSISDDIKFGVETRQPLLPFQGYITPSKTHFHLPLTFDLALTTPPLDVVGVGGSKGVRTSWCLFPAPLFPYLYFPTSALVHPAPNPCN